MKSLIFFTFQQSSHRRVWRIFAQIPTIRIMQRGGKNGISIETDQFFKRAGTPPSLPSVCQKQQNINAFSVPFFMHANEAFSEHSVSKYRFWFRNSN